MNSWTAAITVLTFLGVVFLFAEKPTELPNQDHDTAINSEIRERVDSESTNEANELDRP